MPGKIGLSATIGRRKSRKSGERGIPGDAYTAATKLLNFAAALLR
jgi:hypothetical protein